MRLASLLTIALSSAACGVAFSGTGGEGGSGGTSAATGPGGDASSSSSAGGDGGDGGAATSTGGSTGPVGGGGAGGMGHDGTNAMASSLEGMRVEQPCLDDGQPWCACPPYVETARAAGGQPAVLYDVTVRLRGVIETNTYTGGTADGIWNIGGTPNQNTWDAFGLSVSDPPETYHFNRGPSGGDDSIELDATRTIPIREGASVTLWVDADGSLTSPNESQGDGPPIVPEGVPPAPQVFDGHFVQLYVVDVSVAP